VTELDLLTPSQAAEMLTISVKVLREHVDAGEIAFIPKGSGKKRPRMAFDRKDILDFINRRRMRKCPSTSPKTRRITNLTSNVAVIGFLERREKLLEEKRKR